MGLSLLSTFRAAGLPGPELMLEAPIGAGANSPAFGWANVLDALSPLLEGGETLGPLDLDAGTLTERLDDEIAQQQGFVIGPLMYGAWCRLPA